MAAASDQQKARVLMVLHPLVLGLVLALALVLVLALVSLVWALRMAASKDDADADDPFLAP